MTSCGKSSRVGVSVILYLCQGNYFYHSPFEAKIAFLPHVGQARERRHPVGWGALGATNPGTGSSSAGMGGLVPRKARLVHEIGPAPRPTAYFGAGRRPKT